MTWLDPRRRTPPRRLIASAVMVRHACAPVQPERRCQRRCWSKTLSVSIVLYEFKGHVNKSLHAKNRLLVSLALFPPLYTI